MHNIWVAVIGLVVGLVARVILPGAQSVGVIFAAVLGVSGSFLASYIGQATGWYSPDASARFGASVLGAIVLLFVVGRLKGSSS